MIYKIYKFISAIILINFICILQLIAQDLNTYSYDIGSPTLVDYYVDINLGSNSNTGTSQSTAWKTIEHAWNQIPSEEVLSHGYRINIASGTYSTSALPNYWELKQGSATAPIILRSADGQGTVTFTRDINMANVSYFYLIGINIIPTGGGDTFHCENCSHLLIRGCVLNGGSTTDGAHETLKVNQSQYVYIENNNIYYADDNNIDFVGVQYGHIIGNKVHDASDWCAYVKGGSSYIRIESNEFYNCGTGGFTAGQGSGFQFMTSPWLHYEAYDVKFINNIIHDTEGAAFGVNGGYNILMAHNTAFKTGTRDHLLEVVFGERTCDGENDGDSEATCLGHNSAGGWGPRTVHVTAEPVGNKNVFIYNNIFYNPIGTVAPQQFAIYGSRSPSSNMNLANPQVSDDNLIIAGNIIWNGDENTLIGVEDTEQGCQSDNPTCNLSQLGSDNYFNSLEPEFINPSSGDLRPSESSNLISITRKSLANFAGGDAPTMPTVPTGVLANAFTRDFSGIEPSGARLVGALASSNSALTPPAIADNSTPNTPAAAPNINKITLKLFRVGRKVKVNIKANIQSTDTITACTANIKVGRKDYGNINLNNTSGSSYKGKKQILAQTNKKLKITITASTNSTSSSKVKSQKTP